MLLAGLRRKFLSRKPQRRLQYPFGKYTIWRTWNFFQSNNSRIKAWFSPRSLARSSPIAGAEREYVTTLYSPRQQVSSPEVPSELGVVFLFCLLGLTLSMVALPWLDADAADFILNHLG